MQLIENIKKTLNRPKQYYCLRIVFNDGQEETIHGLRMVANPAGDFFVEEAFGPCSMNDFLLKSNAYPVLINFEGHGILSKDVPFKEGYLKSLLFRTNLDDVYIYETVIDTQVFVSYTRKTSIDVVLDAFAKADFQVTRFTLGPFITKQVIPFLQEDVKTLQTANYEIQVQEGKILSYTKEDVEGDGTIHLLEEKFSIHHITALSIFLSEKLNHPLIEGALPILENNREALLYKNIFKKGGIAVLALILASLVIGHFMKQSKTNTFVEKQSEISFLQQSQNTLKALQEEKESKEYILANSGYSKNGVFTKYAADITNTIPKSIVLEGLDIQPLTQKIKADEKIEIVSNRIQIKGISLSDQDVDQWVDALKKIGWVQRLEFLDYQRDKSGNGVFELLLEIK